MTTTIRLYRIGFRPILMPAHGAPLAAQVVELVDLAQEWHATKLDIGDESYQIHIHLDMNQKVDATTFNELKVELRNRGFEIILEDWTPQPA